MERRATALFVAVLATIVGCSEDKQAVVGASRSAIEEDECDGGQRQCAQRDLYAYREYEPPSVINGDQSLEAPDQFLLPIEAWVHHGSAGDGVLRFRFALGEGPEVECVYRGQGIVDDSEPGDYEQTREYVCVFESCDNGLQAGQTFEADRLYLHIESADPRYGRTKAHLPLREPPPCTCEDPPSSDSGVDSGCGIDASCEPLCLTFEAWARRLYDPDAHEDFELTGPRAGRFAIPPAIPVLQGNAGNQRAILRFRHADCPEVVCTYRGGASVEHPSDPEDVALGEHYLFESCDNGMVAGDVAAADWILLHVENGDSLRGTTKIGGAFSEEAPCGPVEPDPECNDDEPTCQPTGVSEDVCNGLDDDCDEAIDEDYVPAASVCGIGACGSTGTTTCVGGQLHDDCVPGAPAPNDATCDGIDDDCDGLADEDFASTATSCGVGACATAGTLECVSGLVVDTCAPGTPAAADMTCNGIDDDCDGLVDEDYVPYSTLCGFGACQGIGTALCTAGQIVDTCQPTCFAEQCGSGEDDDGDGLVDCADPDCAGDALCIETQCGNAQDDDGDGYVDCEDPDCADAPICFAEVCGDGQDNDGNGLADCLDPACRYEAACSNEICDNGFDDDGDGVVDCADPVCSRTTYCNTPVPNPADIAPELPVGETPSTYDLSRFLYESTTPVQVGVVAGTIDRDRAARLTGKVFDRFGEPLSDVTISVVGHPELGSTRTRSDGAFDLVVNGGGVVALDYRKDGFLPVQRLGNGGWGQHRTVKEVVLTSLDSVMTPIALGSADLQVARATVQEDSDGARQATLLVKPGTAAGIISTSGLSVPVDQISFRATEYTVGANGPKAMPGELPATSAYTYAVELSADETLGLGDSRVSFSAPVFFYLENFIGAPVGSAVPMGYYDREKAVWIPSENGRVIQVVRVIDGIAELDVSGDGEPDDPVVLGTLNIDQDELRAIATLYAPGQQLWRVPVDHFTPWDCNWPWGPPQDGGPPPPPFGGGGGDGGGDGGGGGPECGDDGCEGGDDDDDDEPRRPEPDESDCNDEASGSIIYCQGRAVGKQVPLQGTDYGLVYRSDRVPGRRTKSSARIRVSGASVPASTTSISATISIAGVERVYRFAPSSNLTLDFEWDGRDVDGRIMTGSYEGLISVCNTFPLQYYAVAADQERAFARTAAGGAAIFGTRGGSEVESCQGERVFFAAPHSGQGLGGLTISAHHTLDPATHRVFFGDGRVTSYSQGELGSGFTTPTTSPRSFRTGPDGTSYYLSSGPGVGMSLWAQKPGGTPQWLVGGPVTAICPSTAQLEGTLVGSRSTCTVRSLGIASSGTVYFADSGQPNSSTPLSPRIWEIDAWNRLRHVGGGGSRRPWEIWGGEAKELRSNGGPRQRMAIGRDGSVYLVDSPLQGEDRGWLIIRIGPDRRVYPVVGYKNPTDVPTPANIRDVPGNQVFLRTEVTDLGFLPDGTLVFSTAADTSTGWSQARIWTMTPDGRVSRLFVVSEGGVDPKSWRLWDGPEPTTSIAPAVALSITALDTDENGFVYLFAEAFNNFGIAVWDPKRREVVPITRQGGSPPTPFANTSQMQWGWTTSNTSSRTFSAHPSGAVVVPQQATTSSWIVPLGAKAPAYLNTHRRFFVPGGSVVHVFDGAGRHLADVDHLTGTEVRSFVYDPAGRLIRIDEADGRSTVIERDPNGVASAITGPFGHRTELDIRDGYTRSVTEPTGALHQFGMTPDGLMETYTDPRGLTWEFEYDELGRLVSDTAPDGGTQRLGTASNELGSYVWLESAEGRVTSFVGSPSTGSAERRIIFPDGLVKRSEQYLTRRTTTLPDGTSIEVQTAADPRFGMRASYPASSTIRMPGGRTRTVTRTRTVESGTLVGGFPGVAATSESVRHSDGRTWWRHYNNDAREYRFVSPAGRETRVRLDALGRTVEVRAGGIAPQTFTYDATGSLASTRSEYEGEVRSSTIVRGSDGYVRQVVLSDGTSRSFDPDEAGRPRSVTNQDGGAVDFTWDPTGNATSVTPPGRTSHQLEHSHRNHLTRYSAPSVAGMEAVTTWQDDLDGKLDLMSLADGRTIDLRYDAGGRVSEMHNSRGVTSYTYHPTYGQLTRVTAPGGQQVNLAWDGFLKTSESWAGAITGTVAYRYDTQLRMDRRTVMGTAIDYGYDADDLLTSAGALTIGRHPQHGLETSTTVSNTTTSTLYNGFGEPRSWTANHPGGTLGFTYEYDALGRIVQRTEQNGAQTRVFEYAYDFLGRLTAVSVNGAVVEAYDYDPNGNRTYAENATGTLSAADIEHDAQDRLVRYGNLRFTYNLHGQLQTRENFSTGQLTQYTYDELGNLTRAQLPGGTVIDYLIDGFGRRIGKRVDGVLERGWIYQDQLNPVAELTTTGTVRSRFVYGTKGHVPDLVLRDGRTYRVLTDHLGSVRRVIDAETGVIAQELDYDAWGRVVMDTNPGFQPFGYAGGLYDRDTRLVRFGARDYDAEIGRWTARDPILFKGGQANLYAYVGSDPINLIDPGGLDGFLADAWNGFQSYGENFGTALAHLSARLGAFGPEGEAYAKRLDYIMGSGLTAGTYFPDAIFRPGSPCDGTGSLIDGVRNSTGALPDFVREHPGYLVGRGGSGLAVSLALSSPIGLSVTALALYGGGIQAAQRGENVLQGVLLGGH